MREEDVRSILFG